MLAKYHPKNLSNTDLLDLAMIMQNINDYLIKQRRTSAKYPDCKLIRLEADMHNFDNEYFLENYTKPYYDAEDGVEVAYAYTDLRDTEIDTFSKLIGAGVIMGANAHTESEEVRWGGTFIEQPKYYDIVVDTKIFEDYYKQVTDYAQAKMLVSVELSFIKISTPLLLVNEQSYELPTMRDGSAFIIVHYCYQNFIGKEVLLGTLRDNLPLRGVSNINQALKNSHFDQNNGILRAFVSSQPKIITFNSSAMITQKDLKEVISISNK